MPLTFTARRLVDAIVAGFTPPSGVTDEGVLEQLLADGEIDGADRAYCPAHKAITAHALHTDGSQSCIDCNHTLNGAS
ncbi:hypothetical protein ACFY3G_02900 [Streptomyces phaeochromogenes]|uniref:hypothetical protein n=1 Tax=Streptomyces phaeochromogenes TaxID=1923 RepID=UPI0036BF887B